jgi:hypothetical protein
LRDEEGVLTNAAQEEGNEKPSSFPEHEYQMAESEKTEDYVTCVAGGFVGTIFEEDDLSAVDDGPQRTIPGVVDNDRSV